MGVRDVLRQRDAALYLAGAVVSQFGSSAMRLAASVWVKSLTGSDGLATLALCVLWVPSLAGPWLGSLADRVRRKPLLIASGAAMAALLPVLLVVRGPGEVWVLYAVLMVYGAQGVVQDAAENALLPAVLGPELLAESAGLRLSATEGLKLVSPLAGAGLFTAFGGPAVALLDAATFAASALVFALMRAHEPAPVSGRRAATAGGVRALWAAPGARALVLTAAASLALAGVGTATRFAAVDQGLGRPPAFLGVLTPVQGAGSVVTGLLAGRLLRRVPDRVFAAAGTALFALSLGALALPDTAAVVGSSLGTGLGLPCALVAGTVAVQRQVPAEVLGRASAAATTLVFGPNAVVLAAGAWLVSVADYRAVLACACGLGLAVAALALRGGRRST